MEYLIYVSTARKLMTEPELLDILTSSRENNEEKNLTGILLYSDGTFIQMLEGKADDIESTYTVIKQDIRHKNLIKLIEGTAMARSFPEWSMGFKSINADQLRILRGYFDLKTASLEGTHPGLIMIKTFTETNRI